MNGVATLQVCPGAETISLAQFSLMNRNFHSRMLLDATMLCGVISAMAEFMARALHSRMPLDGTTAGC